MKEVKDLKSKLVIVTGFLALYFIFDVIVLAQIALGLGLVFLISSKVSGWILWLWEKIGHTLGWINSRILLTVVFYVVLLPFALLFRLFNRDPLSLRWANKDSAYTIRDHTYVSEDLADPW